MIIEMFIDIKSFLIVFFIGIFAFADTFYILDMIFKLKGTKMPEPEFEGVTGGSYPMSIKYVYL
jgi:hypothetical protein